MSNSLRPRLMIAISMAVFGTIALFVRNIPVSSALLALCRAVIATVLIGLYLLAAGQRSAVKASPP